MKASLNTHAKKPSLHSCNTKLTVLGPCPFIEKGPAKSALPDTPTLGIRSPESNGSRGSSLNQQAHAHLAATGIPVEVRTTKTHSGGAACISSNLQRQRKMSAHSVQSPSGRSPILIRTHHLTSRANTTNRFQQCRLQPSPVQIASVGR